MMYGIWRVWLILLIIIQTVALEGRTRKITQKDNAKKTPEKVIDYIGQQAVTRGPQAHLGKYEFDLQSKRKEVELLVSKGVDYFNKTKSIEKAFHAFSNDPEFLRGELYLFVYDMEGTCYASGYDLENIWKDRLELRDAYGTYIVKTVIDKAKQGGGWVTYEWDGAIKVTYTKLMSKDGIEYAIGCGYYPFSKEDAVVGLVKAGVALFEKTMSEGKAKTEAFGLFGYPLGRFVAGDLYLYAMTFSGDIVAQGERSGLIGTNGWNYQDARGVYVNREIVEKLKTSTQGIWVEYLSKRAPKKAYAEKVVDDKGVEYFIACGYYPDADRNAVVDLVRKGYVFMKSRGLTEAAREFNNLDRIEFRYGDLYLYVVDLEGNCIAEGSNPEIVGRNLWDEKDEDGRYFVRDLIQKAKDGGGWVDYKFKGSFKSNYVELVDLGTGKYVIGSGLYPQTKLETMTLLAKSAADFLRSTPKIKNAMAEFTKPRGRFVRGDLSVFVQTMDGICLAFGTEYELIWRNLSTVKDVSGSPISKLLVESVGRGPGLVTFTQDSLKQVAYVEEVKKDSVSYIVGVRYYQ